MRWRIGLVISLGLALVAAGTFADPGKDSFVGQGGRIVILGGGRVYEIPADEPCWVLHGWTGDRVPRMQPGIKDEQGDRKLVNAGRSYFKLYIDNEPVKLTTRVIIVPGGPDGRPGECSVDYDYYVQFPANYFAPDTTYTLTGVWDWSNPNVVGGDLLPYVYDATLIVNAP